MPIDFTLTPEQQRLRADARTFARDVLSKVGSATQDLPTPLARFAATRPFYEQTVAAGFLRRLIPAALGGQGTGVVDMAVLAEEFYAVDVNVSLTLLGTMLGLFPVLLGGTPEQAGRMFAPFAAGQGTPLAAFAFSEPGGSANFAAPAPAEGVRTQAHLEGDHWVISGAKKWVSSGTGWDGKGADLLTVVCRTDPDAPPESGISVIAVRGPAEARAQEPPRVIGFLGSGSVAGERFRLAAFVQGLKDTGFIEGNNISIEWRWAEGQYDRLPSLAGELVSRGVAVIVAFDAPASFAAKGATKTIPIVFFTGADPVKTGLVDSFSRPGGNLTGVFVLVSMLGPKRLELLRELLPSISTIALLVNPNNPNVGTDAPDTEAAANALGRRLEVLTASTERDLEAAFTTMVKRQAGALVVMPDPFFVVWCEQLVALAARHAMPAIYPLRWFTDLGGLMSYGSSTVELTQPAGTYTGKILRGAKPADLPVQQSTKFELVINLKTAKALGLTIPPTLLVRADEVIE